MRGGVDTVEHIQSQSNFTVYPVTLLKNIYDNNQCELHGNKYRTEECGLPLKS